MKTKPRQSGLPRRRPCRSSGLTLTEMIVVVSIVAVLTVLGVPAIRAFISSLESGSSAKAMISASLASARAIAAKEQRYAGVRFQNKYQQDGKGCQYMIFIVHDQPNTKLANGFRAVEGLEPIKLPDSVGVMDLELGSTDPDQIVNGNDKIDEDWEVADTTTFSIIFSPSGKLVIHEVRVRNRDGETATSGSLSNDDIFNRISQIEAGIGMFLQDDYYPGYTGTPTPNFGLGPEPSRNSFIIYDKTVFEKLAPDSRYDDYLKELAAKEVIYINPYTGTMINK
jgi:prepilin-type N-terminal cleavage/methylation domain-containing protein